MTKGEWRVLAVCLLCVGGSSAHSVHLLPLKLAVTPFLKGRSSGLPKAAQEGGSGAGIGIRARRQSLPELHVRLVSFQSLRGLDRRPMSYPDGSVPEYCMDGALQSDILAHAHPKYRIVSPQSLFSVTFLVAVFVLRPQLSDMIGKGLPRRRGKLG